MNSTRDRLIEHLLFDFKDAQEVLKETDVTLCHYTSAENAIKILESGHIWMRQPHCMNDLTELRHGLEQVNEELKGDNDRLRLCLNSIKENFFESVAIEFKKYYDLIYTEHFVLCLSEHKISDEIGKLSMWRAYGGDVGVCIVFKKDVFLDDGKNDDDNPGDEPTVVKVRYSEQGVVKGWIDDFCNKVEEIKEEILTFESEEAARIIAYMINLFVLSVKQKAFKEEQEWRVVYTDFGNPSKYLRREVEVLKGIPQEVCKIILKEMQYKNKALKFEELIDYILIGPTQYPLPIYGAFVKTLNKIGILGAETKVKLTSIPLRTYS